MPRDDKDGVKRNRNLVRRILENPNLPAYVAQLEPSTLNRLVQYVGKEDAQELIEYATQAQLQELVELDTWRSDSPGAAEQFESSTFIEWLLLFEEMGSAFLAEKVQELGADQFALALDDHVVVVDITSVGVLGDVETFSTFGVLPKDEDTWPPIRSILTEIWDQDPDFIEIALGQCCQRRSLLAERAHIVGNDTLMTDVSSDRDARRQRQGYVTPLGAAVFLGETKGIALDHLIITVAYDPITSMQLREIRARKQSQSGIEASRASTDGIDQQSESGPVADNNVGFHGEEFFAEIEALMKEAAVIASPASTRLLGAPGQSDDISLRNWLRQLGETNPEALEARMDEVVYLANILVAGTSIQGATFSEAEAVQCVYATCNLGIDYCLGEEPFDDERSMLATFLEAEPGMIKAFRIGYHLIGQLPFKSIVALVRSLTSTRAQRRLLAHPWIQQQIADEMNLQDLSDGVRAEHIGKVKDILDLLESIFDPGVCEQLRIICDPLPCLPRSLEPGAGPQLTVNRARRYIQRTADLRRLLEFLERLDIAA